MDREPVEEVLTELPGVLGADKLRCLIGTWKTDIKRSALARLAVDPDSAAALFHRPVDHRQAEPSALAFVFGREERLKNMGLRLRIHSNPRIAHRQHHVAAGADRRVPLRRCGVQFDVGGFDRQAASSRHRVPRVNRQIHNHLLDSGRIGFHLPERRRRKGYQIDIFADQVTQHVLERRPGLRSSPEPASPAPAAG